MRCLFTYQHIEREGHIHSPVPGVSQDRTSKSWQHVQPVRSKNPNAFVETNSVQHLSRPSLKQKSWERLKDENTTNTTPIQTLQWSPFSFSSLCLHFYFISISFISILENRIPHPPHFHRAVQSSLVQYSKQLFAPWTVLVFGPTFVAVPKTSGKVHLCWSNWVRKGLSLPQDMEINTRCIIVLSWNKLQLVLDKRKGMLGVLHFINEDVFSDNLACKTFVHSHLCLVNLHEVKYHMVTWIKENTTEFYNDFFQLLI